MDEQLSPNLRKKLLRNESENYRVPEQEQTVQSELNFGDTDDPIEKIVNRKIDAESNMHIEVYRSTDLQTPQMPKNLSSSINPAVEAINNGNRMPSNRAQKSKTSIIQLHSM
jgi:hypothetical protein